MKYIWTQKNRNWGEKRPPYERKVLQTKIRWELEHGLMFAFRWKTARKDWENGKDLL